MVAMLTRPTLMLNRNWQPVGFASVARSLRLVAAERARIVDPTDFQQFTWADWASSSNVAATLRPARGANRKLVQIPQRGVLDRGIG
jgi:hypothetical protein